MSMHCLTHMDVWISRDGYIHHDGYRAWYSGGGTGKRACFRRLAKRKKPVPKVNFLPDPEIFEKTRFKEDEVKSRMHETAYLNPALTIIYEDKRGRGSGTYCIS